MKILCSLLVIAMIIPPARGAEPISIETFKQIRRKSERLKLIEQAPPSQKEELRAIDLHLDLVDAWHGEAELKQGREDYSVTARGLGPLEGVFDVQQMVWSYYVSDNSIANEKAGIPLKEQQRLEMEMHRGLDAAQSRLPVVRSLVFMTASSPQALELAKRCQNWIDDKQKRFGVQAPPRRPITREYLTSMDKECDEFFSAIKKLPTLTPEQAQKEYDAFPESRMPQFSGH